MNAHQAFERARRLVSQGSTHEARTVLLRAAAGEPNNPRIAGLLAYVLALLAEHEKAHYYGTRAVVALPNDLDLRRNLASTCMQLGRYDEAVEQYEAACTSHPDDERAHDGLLAALEASGRRLDAERRAREALRRFPHSALIPARLADTLASTGRVNEAVTALRDAAAQHPDDHALATDLCSAAPYDQTLTPQQAFEPFRAYGELVRRMVPSPAPLAPPLLDPSKRLRIGFLSPDLRSHAVATFLEPLLKHVDRSAFETIAYATGAREDEVTRRLRGLVSEWRSLAGTSPNALPRAIAQDRPDVLVDLSGHSAGHALPIFQLRLAPVQITYLGWPSTTGVPEMDYRITDSVADPEGSEQFHSERLIRLDPCALCYRPHDDAPDVRERALDQPPTFGSFNALAKMNDEVVALWARILRESPDARLILKHTALVHEQGRVIIERRFADAGVQDGRLTLLPPTSHAEHLGAYHEVDVALDPFPFNGATTTCDALWMGVPVVTLPGATSASRVASSILRAAGLTELVATSPDDYAAKASSVLRDRERLRELRASLRRRIAQSPICDAPAFATRFGEGVRRAWTERCARGA